MPIDASIPLQAQSPNPMEAYGKGMMLNSLGMENQVKSVQLEQLKSQLLGEQTLAKMMGDPSMTTNQGGVPTLNPQAESKLIQTSPGFGMEHAKQMLGFRQQLQQMNNEQLTGAKTRTELMSKSAMGVMQTYQQALQQTNNPQQAMQAATQARNSSIAQMVQMGAIPPDQAQQMLQQPFNPQEWQQKMMQGEDYYKMLNAEHQTRMEGMTQERLNQGDRRIDQQDKRMNAILANQTGNVAPGITGNTGTSGAPGFTPDAVDLAAREYLKTGQIPNMGWGASGMPARKAVLNKAAELAKTEYGGMEGGANARFGVKAASASLSKIQQQKTMTGAFEETAVKNADLALNASEQVDRTGVTLFNKWLQSGRTATGSPAAAKFNAANQTFVNEYAKVISGSMGNTAVSDSARNHAESILNTAHTNEQYRQIIGLLKQEMSNRMKGFDDEIGKLNSSMQSKTAQTANDGSDQASPGNVTIDYTK